MVKVDGSQLQHKVIIMNSVVYRQTKPIMSIINLADQIQYKIQPKVYIWTNNTTMRDHKQLYVQ